MSAKPIYETDYSKYNRIDYGKCCSLESNLKKTFHTCPALMERKKKLEGLVWKSSGNQKLKKHFRIKYNHRKQDFYRKIIYELIDETTENGREISELTKDILFIYSKKVEEMEYVDYLSNHLEAEESHRQEYRESMIEDFRGCD